VPATGFRERGGISTFDADLEVTARIVQAQQLFYVACRVLLESATFFQSTPNHDERLRVLVSHRTFFVGNYGIRHMLSVAKEPQHQPHATTPHHTTLDYPNKRLLFSPSTNSWGESVLALLSLISFSFCVESFFWVK
jgi:hypothetical protein